jgi:hypothetical protein
MDSQRLSAVLLLAGFTILVLSFLLGPPGMAQTYQPPDPDRRLQIIEEYKSRWNISQSLVALGILITAVGFAVLASHLSAYEGAYSAMQTLYYSLSLGGLLLFGVAILQASLPAWLGYLTAGAALIYGAVFLVTGSGFATPFLISILSLVIAIILLLQKPLP